MNRFLLGAVVVSVFGLGCPSATDVCKSGVDQVCERLFECRDEPAAAQTIAVGTFTDVADCKKKLYANPGALPPGSPALPSCEARKSMDENCTGTDQGKKFNLGNAADCKNQRAKLSCQDYLAQLGDISKAPAVCAKRCE